MSLIWMPAETNRKIIRVYRGGRAMAFFAWLDRILFGGSV